MAGSPDGRHPIALAMEWVSKVITVVIAMMAPAWIGWWLDQRFDQGYLTMVGMVLGFVFGFILLLRMVKVGPGGSSGRGKADEADHASDAGRASNADDADVKGRQQDDLHRGK